MVVAICLCCLGQTGYGQAPEATGPLQESARTSDGVDLAIWYYPSATDEALATVILVHDLAGSHATLEPLAIGLQAAGLSVVAPDLRGHGDSTKREWPGGRTDTLKADRLLKADLEAVAVSQGGRVREQARLRGDLETVYAWIRRTAKSDKLLDATRLCMVGSGLGGTLASLWTAADAAWPPLASGPPGRQRAGLVPDQPCVFPQGGNDRPCPPNSRHLTGAPARDSRGRRRPRRVTGVRATQTRPPRQLV